MVEASSVIDSLYTGRVGKVAVFAQVASVALLSWSQPLWEMPVSRGSEVSSVRWEICLVAPVIPGVREK